MRMPDGSGWDLAQRLRGERPELRVLFITGFSDELLQYGKNLKEKVDYVLKPFLLANFLDIVRQRLKSA